MTTGSEWTGRVGESWAAHWQATDRSFGPLTDRLLDHPAVRSFSSALDIGCGAGELSCRLAQERDDARITGVDIAAPLLVVARQRCEGPRFVEADAASFTPDHAPDLLVSRHGVMFFDDPEGAFGHLARIASQAATLRFSCFRQRAENGWALSLAALVSAPDDPVESPPEPAAPGPFAFGDADRVRRILAQAGWEDAAFEAVDYDMVAGEGDDAVEQACAYFQRIGPAARAMAALPGAERDAATARLRRLVEAHHQGGRVALPAAAWIVTARRAD